MRPDVLHQSFKLATCPLKALFNIGHLAPVILYFSLEFLFSCSQLIQFFLFSVQIFVADGFGACPPEFVGNRSYSIGRLLENIHAEQRPYGKRGLCNDFLALNKLVLTPTDVIGRLIRIHHEEVS